MRDAFPLGGASSTEAAGGPSGRTALVDSFVNRLTNRVRYADEVRAAVQRHKHVVFYGCGAILGSIVETWQQFVGRRIDYCCDSDPTKWGMEFHGATCLSPDELLRLRDDCIVFVTIGSFEPVTAWLREKGFPAVSLLYKYDLVNADYLDTQDVTVVATRLAECRGMFDDAKSLAVFDAICQRVLEGGRPFSLMTDICEGNQYFPADIVRLGTAEQFVDLGAFDGDTVADFVRRTDGRFDRIDAFELDRINFGHLQQNVARLPHADRIRTFNLGVWDAELDVTYSIGKSQSTVGHGTTTGRVVPLDSVLRDDPVSFIKIDIEGAELHALRGARAVIARNRPTLAVCVYHHFSHLWEIPFLVREMLPDHHLHLRHHTPLEYETVLYAIRP